MEIEYLMKDTIRRETENVDNLLDIINSVIDLTYKDDVRRTWKVLRWHALLQKTKIRDGLYGFKSNQ